MLKKKDVKVVLLVGKVACGKTTYARKMEQQENAIFLSLDELQIDLFGPHPTREQLDTTHAGCYQHQQRLALKLLQNGFDVYLDWGFWEQSARTETRLFFENKGIKVYQYYFDIPLTIRQDRNRNRNQGNDPHSFKIEEKDIAFFDGFFEAPTPAENDKIFNV